MKRATAVPRPRTATVRLTEEQFTLARQKFEREPGMSFQKILTAAVNAYIRGDFRVNPDGSYTLGEPDVISFVDDAEALDLDDIDAAPPEILTTRDLAELATRRTARRVPLPALRRLVREEFPQAEDPGPGFRYRWRLDDPVVEEIILRIADGALDRLVARGLSEASRNRSHPSTR